MKCPTCGRPVDAVMASICPSCGQSLPVKSAKSEAVNAPSTEAETSVAQVATQDGRSQAAMTPPPATMPPSFSPPAQYEESHYAPGGYAPGYGYPSAPYPYYAPYAPRRGLGLIVSITIAIVVVVFVSGTTFALLSLRQPTPAQTAGAQVTAASTGPIIYNNTFTKDAAGWPNEDRCKLGKGGYHVSGAACIGPIENQADVDITITMKEVSGALPNDMGIVLRDTDGYKHYLIGIASDMTWFAFLCLRPNSDGTPSCQFLGDTSAATIHTGLNVSNTLEVRAKGTFFEVIVNGASAGSFGDGAYTSGGIGLFCSNGAECVFSQLTVRAFN